MVIRAQSEPVIQSVMELLELEIPEFKVDKKIKLTLTKDEVITINGMDSKTLKQCDFLKSVKINDKIGNQ